MQHNIPVSEASRPMAEAISACVHCGFCLPTCPTYVLMGNELHSPRGRILLMKEVLEGNLALEEATPYLDPCLGCLACVSACPSGVAYGELITPFRMHSEPQRARPLLARLVRLLLLETLPYPHRFRAAALAGRLAQLMPARWRRYLPVQLQAMLELLPARLPKAPPLPERYPAIGRRRARVALLAGCAQQVLAPEINWATLRVLARQGVEVLIPRQQGCCGALAAHTGAAEVARRLARRTMAAFPDDVDAVISNAAGCGSGMHEYSVWFAGEPEAQAAAAFARRVKDVSVFLHELGLIEPPQLTRPLRVAYHDACHLAHAQGVTHEPRALLAQLGVTLLEPEERELCCGSAGSYNIEQPETAGELGRRKADRLRALAPEVVVSGNIGCLTQLKRYLGELPVMHTIELIDAIYRER